MTKKEIINVLNKYKLDKEKYIVISGAALVLQNIKKETNDIDIWVDNEYYTYLLDNYECVFERINEKNNKCYMIDNIINFGTSYCPKNTKIINDIRVSSIKDILELKKILNRPKDKEIIKVLEEIITKEKK